MQHNISPEKQGPLGSAMSEAISTCVHCGFCLAACPTYQELGQETDSPRGRIILMKEVLEGHLPLEQAVPHIDPCLGCLACEPACPSGVSYRNLISPFRAITEDARRRSLTDRLQRAMAQSMLPYPRRFRIAAQLGALARPLSGLMPASLRTMLELLPRKLPKKQRWNAFYPAEGPRRARVALLTGCAQTVLDPDINTATIEVLTRNGVDVLVPPSQTCCGALGWHVGNLGQARQFAERNLKAFPEDIDAIVTNAAGCGSAMHEYHLILKGTAHEEKADGFRRRVVDVTVLLDSLGPLQPFPPASRATRIAYQDACHLANAQGVRKQPRQLLASIPGVEIQEIADAHLCCGSAGTYNIDHPDIAKSLGAQKVARLLAIAPDVIASGNIGCLTQLATHLSRQGSKIPVRHTMQILRDAYRCGNNGAL